MVPSPSALKKRRYRARKALRETEQQREERLQADRDGKRLERQRKSSQESEQECEER